MTLFSGESQRDKHHGEHSDNAGRQRREIGTTVDNRSGMAIPGKVI
jgi:hypothetical protein